MILIQALAVLLGIAVNVEATRLKFIQLKYAAENYVTVYWPDGAVRVDSVPYTHASTFEVHYVSDNQWQLRAMKNNMYLSAEGGGGSTCIVNRTSASGWETFDVNMVSDSQVQLKTLEGFYIGVDAASDNKGLVATETSPGVTETFDVVEVSQLRGVNLGSWFIPEKWMFTDSSELWANSDATDLYSLCIDLGQEEAGRRMQAHWSSWITEDTFKTMAEYGVNHVRIPMGYFDMQESYPYIFGGADFIDKGIEWATKYGMTVLVDLHGAPGSQNGQDHSGHSGEIHWDEPENVALTLDIIEMMAKRWASEQNVWGFELLNEPHYSLSHELLTEFYQSSYERIRKYSADSHVVINSLYGPHDWTATVFPEPEYRNGVLDLHLYTVWSGFSTEEEYYAAGAAFGDEIRSLTPYYPIIVGEMSLATSLNPYSTTQRQTFSDAEMTSFESNAFGFVFWSQKLDYESEDWALEGSMSYVKDYYAV